ncbi:hypothetical protein PAHAL_2G003500 [Panicum hallii]|uniref:Uncharacterized protein n=1 Tax=Panicum hallii TaxID=206008 RepID=A0A2T8KMA2_9POAL|nr:hypothetical protein PAHAL_2G003500 [Panicum hallii]
MAAAADHLYLVPVASKHHMAMVERASSHRSIWSVHLRHRTASCSRTIPRKHRCPSTPPLSLPLTSSGAVTGTRRDSRERRPCRAATWARPPRSSSLSSPSSPSSASSSPSAPSSTAPPSPAPAPPPGRRAKPPTGASPFCPGPPSRSPPPPLARRPRPRRRKIPPFPPRTPPGSRHRLCPSPLCSRRRRRRCWCPLHSCRRRQQSCHPRWHFRRRRFRRQRSRRPQRHQRHRRLPPTCCRNHRPCRRLRRRLPQRRRARWRLDALMPLILDWQSRLELHGFVRGGVTLMYCRFNLSQNSVSICLAGLNFHHLHQDLAESFCIFLVQFLLLFTAYIVKTQVC